MKMLATHRFSAILSGALLITALTGCSSSPEPKQGAATPAASAAAPAATVKTEAPKREKVELQFYMLGNAPKDLQIIQDEVNKLALKDLNTTVKFNYTTWTDWDQKYKLLLSSGQQVDLIFTADWTQYQSYAKKGAFLPLDDILPKAAPTLNKYVPKDMWEAVKIDGKIYTVPATFKEYVTNGFVWREDLRVKYNLPKPTSIETFEAYMDGIKKNEPNILPFASGGDGNLIVNGLRDVVHNSVGSPLYGIGINYNKPGEVYSYWGSEEHMGDIKIAKRWMDKGFIPKNVLNVKDSTWDQLVSGKAASEFGDNPARFNDSLNKMKSTHPDWNLDYYAFPTIKGYAQPVHPIHNGFAIPKSSKNAERALEFYEKMVTDKAYNWLTSYGIEGKNFQVDNGYYKMIGDNNSNGFPRESMNSWAWRNPDFMLFEKSFDGVKAIYKDLDKIQKPDIFTGFAEDYSSYQAEKAALEQVEKQYLWPLQLGLVADLDAGMKTFMEKAKQAGLEKVQAEYKKQWLQYVNEKGIK
ncbi:extracellular solute-binding protein [Paenibacillus sp. 5J-6]|uniref:Extracellular solute-binding protein n=1 Tax=Paenibacillus silvestris TaxID=2606219 RepID=A0A6L8V3L1_9BACL|nr:extracellular solute-binding protein [Paenibacillus silvestris]MZQ84905.1 extracellular solute-binding protein [Paenibacillus silvestris]